ncbi:hypothetical protein QTN25_002833 [Entamoeba marina]
MNSKSHQCDFVVLEMNDNFGYLINYHLNGVFFNSILKIVTTHLLVSYGPLPTNAQSIIDLYFCFPEPFYYLPYVPNFDGHFPQITNLEVFDKTDEQVFETTEELIDEEMDEKKRMFKITEEEKNDGMSEEINENFLNQEKNKTEQNETFILNNLGNIENDTDDSSSNNSSAVSFLEDECYSKFYFGCNTKLFNDYGDEIKKFGRRATTGYPPFLDGILLTFENDEERRLTKPEYENTFYVVDEKDSKSIVAHFLCIFSQISVITDKFLKELKDAGTKDNKTDNSSRNFLDFLALVIPLELGDFPKLKQFFVFKPHNVEFKNRIRFQILSAYQDHDL